ncbi:Bicupin, oxalate decarboxylase/oxidase [Cordyceps fumosorosea ARSEF 2679]|uniref:Bicupin, oxalate decarboxylase/oxidase n=1 Tax=Cordyceps fumosorosea (strain ARSEF 2679) TaxID=1081104 RepID=A0A167N4X9_CORFA|nr:Bicupin, oxalate decarboxylase/oxidase [Cordyceps fumosorosea ARSEF 2679]OAA55131.1 Bicupin, oxalate decarboxylase/oxidase [Cordyceps fumosorosea ARSEF 2679]
MRAASVLLGLAASAIAAPSPSVESRDNGGDQFTLGQPISKDGKGGRILGGTNKELDLQNPDNLGQQSTDAGIVPNLKWSFSDSKTRILKGGWVREQVVTDLPSSHDIAGAQQHLKKGAIRELHWHKVAEWGIIYNGRITVSAVDENGVYQATEIGYGDVWYFPPGVAHTVQDRVCLPHLTAAPFPLTLPTPKDILAKNFGVPESTFKDIPAANPYIFNAPVATKNVTGAVTPQATGDASFVYRTLQHPPEKIGGTGGTFYKIDSTNFPISKEIAATFVTLKPGGLRELHWHPNAEEWLYFHKGKARATAFIGNGAARTFDFSAGDTAVFPTNAGHYIENTSKDEDLVWIEIYKSDHVADVSLSQWLALTPPEIAAQTLKVPVEFIEQIKREKQVLIE